MVDTLAVFIPITFFICITLAIKFIVENGTRRKIVSTNASEDLIRVMFDADERSRKNASMKWGLVLISVGVAFGVIEVFEMRMETPGAFALLSIAAGAALLVHHRLSRTIER